MTQFVDDDPKFVAIFPNGNGLCPVTPFADERTAPENKKCQNRFYWNISNILKCCRHAVPASAFRENDKVRVIGRTFNKFDAGEVFPVAHGLLK